MASGTRYSAPKGTADVLPGDSELLDLVEERFSQIASLYAFRPVRTPVFEQTEVFERSVGVSTDIVGKEMYAFTDRGERSLTLRPEGTAPIVRAFVEHGIGKREHLPWKVYYSGPMFRYERPQAGRMREFRQVGAESIGSADSAVDVELIELAMRFYRLIGVSEIELILNSMGDGQCRPKFVERLRAFLRDRLDSAGGFCADCVVRIENNPLRVLDCKKPACSEITSDAPAIVESLCEPCEKHFSEVRRGLDDLRIPYVISGKLVRGLDYYTRTTFEIRCRALDAAQDAVGGGGRYDSLVEVLGGEPTPAIGFALGLERTIAAMKVEASPLISTASILPTRALVAPLTENARGLALRIASEMREAGITTEIGGVGRSVKSQLRLADRLGAAIALLIGDDELRDGTVTLRSLGSDRTQSSYAHRDVVGAAVKNLEQ